MMVVVDGFRRGSEQRALWDHTAHVLGHAHDLGDQLPSGHCIPPLLWLH